MFGFSKTRQLNTFNKVYALFITFITSIYIAPLQVGLLSGVICTATIKPEREVKMIYLLNTDFVLAARHTDGVKRDEFQDVTVQCSVVSDRNALSSNCRTFSSYVRNRTANFAAGYEDPNSVHS